MQYVVSPLKRVRNNDDDDDDDDDSNNKWLLI